MNETGSGGESQVDPLGEFKALFAGGDGTKDDPYTVAPSNSITHVLPDVASLSTLGEKPVYFKFNGVRLISRVVDNKLAVVALDEADQPIEVPTFIQTHIDKLNEQGLENPLSRRTLGARFGQDQKEGVWDRLTRWLQGE